MSRRRTAAHSSSQSERMQPGVTTQIRTSEIAVCGMGLTTCLGTGVERNAAELRAGRSGLRPITRLDIDPSSARLGGEAPLSPAGGESPADGESFELTHLRATVREALLDAGIERAHDPDPRVAVVAGTSLAGSSTAEQFFSEYERSGPQAVDYGLLASYCLEDTLAALAHEAGAGGPCVVVSNACAAGGSSIAVGARWLASGRADLVVAIGYDPLSLFTYAGFASLLALSPEELRPFSRNRQGMLLGDGFAALILERRAGPHRAKRPPLAILSGWGESTDAYHLTRPHPEGAGAVLAMRRAIDRAGLEAGDIAYVNCHGTGTKPNDASEARALREVFGPRLARIPVSSSKPFFGHTLGGAGTVEAVVTLIAIRDGFLPPNLNLDEVDPEAADLDIVTETRESTIAHAMSNSFGFGGSNTSLIFSRAEFAVGGSSRWPPPAERAVVAIRGTGIVSAHGVGTDEFWARLLDGTCSAMASPPSSRGIPVPPLAASLDAREEEIQALVDGRSLRRVSALSRASVAAAVLAFGGETGRPPAAFPCEDAAVVLGTAFGSSRYHFEYYENLFRGGVRDASPLLFSESVMNAASGRVSLYFGLKGASLALVGGEEIGLTAIADAADRILTGEASAGLAGGAEEYCDFLHAGLARRGYIGAGSGDGSVFAEGAAILWLERDALHERARSIYIDGWGAGRSSRTAATAEERGREAVELAVRAAFESGRAVPDEVDLVVLSAATPAAISGNLDGVARAIEARRDADRLVWAPKLALGEGFGFTSAALVALAARAITEGVVPPQPLGAESIRLPLAWRLSRTPVHAPLRSALIVAVNRRGGAVALFLTSAPS
jgi:3-oxoacyl-[acyl-carrier-protein] synthase II